MKIRVGKTKTVKFNGRTCIAVTSPSYDLDKFLNVEIGDYCMFMSKKWQNNLLVSIPFNISCFFRFKSPFYKENLLNSLKTGLIVDKYYYYYDKVTAWDKALYVYPTYNVFCESGETITCRAQEVATDFYEGSRKLDFIINHIKPCLDEEDLDKQKIFDSLKDSFYEKQNEFEKLLKEHK